MPTPPPAAPRRIRPLRWALSIAVTALLVYAMATQVDAERARDVVLGADPGWLGLGFALYVLLQAIRAARYRLLAPEASGRLLLTVHLVHAFLLRVMPFRTGELGFAWLMRRGGAGSMTRNLVGIVVVRVLDLSTVSLVFVGGALAGATESPVSYAILVPLAVLGLAGTLLTRELLSLSARIGRVLMSAARLDRISRVASLTERVETAVAWAESLGRGRVLTVAALTTFQWAVNFVLFGVLLAAMHVSATPAQVSMGGTASIVGGFVPLAGVGNLGPLEAGWALGFASAGLDVEVAVATAFGFSVISFGYAAVTALLGWMALPRRAEPTDPLTPTGTR